MSYQEFIEWQEYYNEEPFLADRLELQLARIGYSNMFTGMSKPEVEQDYFLISHFDDKREKKGVDSKNLESQIVKIFGVK